MGGEIMEKLKAERIRQGITQTEMARRMDVSQSHASMLESGKYEPSWKTLSKIARVLDVDLRVVIRSKAVDK